MKICLFRMVLIISFLFLSGCSGKHTNNFPDCDVPLEHMNNEMTIVELHNSYELSQPLVVKLKNNTNDILVSTDSDFEIKIFKKIDLPDGWEVVNNHPSSPEFESRSINGNSSVYYVFFPDLLGEDKNTEIFVCIFANNSVNQKLLAASANFFLK